MRRLTSLLLPLITLAACAEAPQEPQPTSVENTAELLCLSPVRCLDGECDLGRAVDSPAECTDGLLAHLDPTGFVTVNEARRVTVSDRALAFLEGFGLLPKPAYAQSSGDLFFGVRNGQNMSGQGAEKQCEAKLHICFTGGLYDQALNDPDFIIDTTSECNFICDFYNSPSQEACSKQDCESRCVAARVPGASAECT